MGTSRDSSRLTGGLLQDVASFILLTHLRSEETCDEYLTPAEAGPVRFDRLPRGIDVS